MQPTTDTVQPTASVLSRNSHRANLREQLKVIALALDSLPTREKTETAERYASDLGISKSTLYRWLRKEVGRESGRKKRSDAGTTYVPEESLEFVAALQKTSRRKNGKLVLRVATAASVAIQHGLDIRVGTAQIRRLLKDRGLDAEQQGRDSPHVTMRSLHPNHVHMVDPSLCLLYYTPDGQQHIVREDVAYKNKPDAILKVRLKVWRYVLTDHYSHWIFVRYFEARGETQDSLFRFLMEAWQQREGRTFHGVPKALMMDPGSANTAYAIRNLCDALEVKLLINQPGQPRAKGSVEVAQNIVETHFESLLKFQPVTNVAELNAACDAWCVAWNSNLIRGFDSRLKREGMTQAAARNDLWLRIQPAELRLCPPLNVCAMLMRGATAERQVSNGLTIRYRHPQAPTTRTYDLRNVRELRAGEKVTVRPLVYGNEAVIVEFERYDGTKHSYRIEAAREYDSAGFAVDAPVIGEEYKALPTHEFQADGQRLDELAYGIDGDGVIRNRAEIEMAKKDAKVKPFAHLNDGLGLRPLDALKGIAPPTYLPKKGTALTPKIAPVKPLQSVELEQTGGALCVPSAATLDESATRLTHLQMAKRLRAELGEAWTSARYEEITAAYPQGVTYEEMPAVIEKFQAACNPAPAQPALRLVK